MNITIGYLADLMDDCADQDGQWEGADVCQAIADLITENNGWKHCPDHGVYSARKNECPFDHEEN